MKLALIIVMGLAFGYLLGALLTCSNSQPVPAACVFDGGGMLQSGDAAQTSDGRDWVCTDGTLIPVQNYGQS